MLFAVWEVGLNKRGFLFVFMESDVGGDGTAAKIHRASPQGVITPLKVLQKHTWLSNSTLMFVTGGAMALLPYCVFGKRTRRSTHSKICRVCAEESARKNRS